MQHAITNRRYNYATSHSPQLHSHLSYSIFSESRVILYHHVRSELGKEESLFKKKINGRLYTRECLLSISENWFIH